MDQNLPRRGEVPTAPDQFSGDMKKMEEVIHPLYLAITDSSKSEAVNRFIQRAAVELQTKVNLSPEEIRRANGPSDNLHKFQIEVVSQIIKSFMPTSATKEATREYLAWLDKEIQAVFKDEWETFHPETS